MRRAPQKYAVVGSPIAHSLSPFIHNHWMQAAGLEATYEARHIKEGVFALGLEKLKREGFRGLNVTLPHKQAALAEADTVSDVASSIGAANTLKWSDDGGWHADNTDAAGFRDALSACWSGDLSTSCVFVLGAGGSARAIVSALIAEVGQLIICNRTVARAKHLASAFAVGFAEGIDLNTGLSRLGEADLVINTTSLGHSGDTLVLPEGNGRLFFDISYGAASAPLLSHAVAKGWFTEDGLGMLVAQAAHAFEIWFAISPDRATALELCRARISGGSK